MIMQKYLHEKIHDKRTTNDSWYKPVPKYITNNLNQNFELRGYQIEAIRNFISYYEDSNMRSNPTQVLFQMATGSGKTVIMVALIIYLFNKGFNKFVFCVNSNNIIEKTIDNFINYSSSKFLFRYNNEIEINGSKHKVKKVNSFENNNNEIQILFTTIQKLHIDLNTIKENSLSYDDFSDGIVIISDEAHHLNADTKSNKQIKEDNSSWESTVSAILNQSNKNILLEFTATAGLNNENVKNAYIGKLIYDYPLFQFYKDGYSKEIKSLRSDAEMDDRIIQAIILSQFRMKLFSDKKIYIKPVILFKSRRIEDNAKNFNDFCTLIRNLTTSDLKRILNNNKQIVSKSKIPNNWNGDILVTVNKYLNQNQISLSTLLYELQIAFSPEHCLLTDSKNTKLNKKSDPLLDKDVQLLLNSLEDYKNPYRAIFAVDQLNEGWDVLNLFDIVRLYDTRQDGGKNQSYTIKEAQLIGRGARYCPFKFNDTDEKYKRKYDNEEHNIYRFCETLYYHCYNEERYISELRDALKTTGLYMDQEVNEVSYTIKDDFKNTNVYKNAYVYANKQIQVNSDNVNGIEQSVLNEIFSYREYSGFTGTDYLLGNDKVNSRIGENYQYGKTLKDISTDYFSIVHKASRQFSALNFDKLLKHYPHLVSMKEFFTSDNYLGNINISISYIDETNFVKSLYKGLVKTFYKLSVYLNNKNSNYIGSKEFYPLKLKDVFTNKKITVNNVSMNGGRGISQSSGESGDNQLDLSVTDWYVYNDNYGTDEEKALIKKY